MSNDGRLVEMVYVDRLDFDQDWRPGVRADTAQTTHITLHVKSNELWYRRHPSSFDSDRRLIWRSVSGGTPAPGTIARALDDHEKSGLRPAGREPTYGWRPDERA